MKKLVLSIFLLLTLSFAFADVFPNGEKIVVDFFERGTMIKVIEDSNNIKFIAKSTVSGIEIDEDDIEIATIGYNIMNGKNGDSESYSIKKWKIESDDKGNIIISRK